ncbi:ABC transporter ATP-binding protein [Rubripirellula reticaptiva]|nr:ATP-binding cassette domain-containing protein [Rubripirellula reticaptiva]
MVDVTRRDTKTGRTLLAGVDLLIVAGDAIGLVGPSGSGKSTMLRAIARLDAIDDGQIRFRGKIVTVDRVPMFRRSVVYLAQRPALVPGTVLQNLTLPFTFASATDSFNQAKAIALLSSLGRGESILDQDASTLSGGEQQLVALVRAILVSPTVMLLDEPTASLDAALVQRFETLARQWKDADVDRVWIWTSHDADQISRVSSKLIRLESGSVNA